MPKVVKMSMVSLLLFCMVLLFMPAETALAANAGKIAGRVVDAETGEPLIGANVLIDGTSMGAAADEDGFYFIINVPPDIYTVRAMMVGYTTLVKENVEVNINQTTSLDFKLGSQALEGDAVVVEAERPVIQMDVSSSQKIVTEEAIQDRPLENFEEILSTEVGIDLTASTE
ncbi:MAG: carboxypeptidase-like regulatory domain-containing protein, partial [Calditrichia bacterium]